MRSYFLCLAFAVVVGGCAGGPAQRREAYQPSSGDTQKNLAALLSLPEIARYYGKLEGRVYESSYVVKYGPSGHFKAITTDRKIIIADENRNTVFSKEYRVKPKSFQTFDSSLPYKAVSEPIDYAEISQVLTAAFDDTQKKNLFMSMKPVHFYGIESASVKETIYESIVDGITDEKVLIALAYLITKDDVFSPTCQMRLINRIADQKVLTSLVKNAHNMFVRQAIIERISDETLLIDITQNAKDFYVRKKALMGISDERALTDFAKNAKSVHLRLVATGRIGNETVLIDIARNDKDVSVRKKALMKITDKDALADLAENDRDETIRNAAKKRLDGL
jgi:hypothetical protein